MLVVHERGEEPHGGREDVDWVSTEVDIGEHLEDQLGTFPPSEGSELFHVVLTAMVQDMMHSLALQKFYTLRSARSANDRHARHLTQPLQRKIDSSIKFQFKLKEAKRSEGNGEVEDTGTR